MDETLRERFVIGPPSAETSSTGKGGGKQPRSLSETRQIAKPSRVPNLITLPLWEGASTGM
jgi:hypothetical protein